MGYEQTTIQMPVGDAMTPRASVAATKCISYNRKEVYDAVGRLVRLLPKVQAKFRAAKRVLVKPNLASSRRGPEGHVNTHPMLIQAICELLIKAFDCEVAIGDSCATVVKGSTADALKVSEMDRVAQEVGAELYNVDAQPRETFAFDRGWVYREIPLPSNLNQFDLIVSVAKLKTHSLTAMTGAVKNIFGLVPGAEKKKAHLMAPRPEEFATLLCDLYDYVRPGVAFMDGVMGMEGKGPNNGPLRHVELLAASADPVALDSYCAQVMGFDPLTVPLLAQCHERELGLADPAEMSVRGRPAADFLLPDFALPPTYVSNLVLKMLPRWTFRSIFSAMITRHACIDQALCIRCGECAQNCPSSAIFRTGEPARYKVNTGKCISCYCCDEVCPAQAIMIRPTRFRRTVRAALNLLRPNRSG